MLTPSEVEGFLFAKGWKPCVLSFLRMRIITEIIAIKYRYIFKGNVMNIKWTKMPKTLTYNRLLAIVPGRTEGKLPKISAGVKPFLTQIAHAQIRLNLFMDSLKISFGARQFEWDHYGIAVRNAEAYRQVVDQLLVLGYQKSAIPFSDGDRCCLLTSPKFHIPMKVFTGDEVLAVFNANSSETATLAYLAFTLGTYFDYQGQAPFNNDFTDNVGNYPLVGPTVLGLDQQGFLVARKEVAGWGKVQPQIFDGFTFFNILLLNRSSASFTTRIIF